MYFAEMMYQKLGFLVSILFSLMINFVGLILLAYNLYDSVNMEK